MAFDEQLAERARAILQRLTIHDEKRMFGGLCFMVNGNMCCGISGDELMLRVGPEAYEATLALPHARKMDFTGKPMRGFVTVDAEGFESDAELETWLELALRFASSLPPK